MRRLLILAVALILGCIGFATTSRAASSTTAKPTAKSTTTTATKTTTHEMHGTVSSVTASELVLTHEWKGKTEETKFTVNSSTKKDGTLAKGDAVLVKYEYSNHVRTATEITPTTAKSPTTKKS
ncbi:MAG TPA: DUF5666 domain-containing protein [Candidatus Acidoferrum sp.]|nr:DUF5666 domain-containing protein [Candidatus Acidoferrum sp.]